MTITVDCRPGQARQLMAQDAIDPIECEWDDDAKVTVITVFGRGIDRLLLAIAHSGYRWWRGRPRGAHNDPTYAQAAQRILRREHRR